MREERGERKCGGEIEIYYTCVLECTRIWGGGLGRERKDGGGRGGGGGGGNLGVWETRKRK